MGGMTTPLPAALPVAEPEARPTGRITVPVKYEAMMRYIAANPAFTYQELGRYLGVSAGWVANVVGTDLFVARFQEFMAELDNKMLLPTLVDKVKGATALAVERLSTVIEKTTSEDTILRASDMLLKATKAPATHTLINTSGPVQVNKYSVDPRIVAIHQARRAHLEAAQGDSMPIASIEAVVDGLTLESLGPKPPAVEFNESEAVGYQRAELLRILDEPDRE